MKFEPNQIIKLNTTNMKELNQKVTLKDGRTGTVDCYRVWGCYLDYHIILADGSEVVVSEDEIE